MSNTVQCWTLSRAILWKNDASLSLDWLNLWTNNCFLHFCTTRCQTLNAWDRYLSYSYSSTYDTCTIILPSPVLVAWDNVHPSSAAFVTGWWTVRPPDLSHLPFRFSLAVPVASPYCTAALSCFSWQFHEELHHFMTLPESWSQDISATVTWNITKLSKNLPRHVCWVPEKSYHDRMVGSWERCARRPPLPYICNHG